MAVSSFENSLLFIVFFDSHLMVGTSKAQLGKAFEPI